MDSTQHKIIEAIEKSEVAHNRDKFYFFPNTNRSSHLLNRAGLRSDSDEEEEAGETISAAFAALDKTNS